jgi:hypothetical protein
MRHQMIVLRGPHPTYLSAVYPTAHVLSVDGWKFHSQRLDRESLIETVESSIDEDGLALRVMNVLSIDAWREGDGWTWNAWYHRGTLTVREFSKLGCATRQQTRATLAWFREHGYLSEESKGAVTLEDDGHNLTVLDRRTREPLFAIEYGSVLN